MDVESPGPNHYLLILLVAGTIFVVFLALARLLRGLSVLCGGSGAFEPSLACSTCQMPVPIG
jgi:hypothetical protein